MTAPAPSAPAVIGPQHGLAVEEGLTRDPAKALLYGADPWFRDGWDTFDRVAGSQAAAFAHDHALMLLKPDAAARRVLLSTIDWLESRGASVVASEAIQLDRFAFRTMWQYQLGVSTRDRRELGDAIVTAGRSLLVVVRLPHAPVPATVRLSSWKGPADPARRVAGQLRHSLGGGNFLLNFVHAADEPADLVRELSILLPDAPRERAVRAIVAGPCSAAAGEARRLATELESTGQAHDLRLESAVANLTAAVEAAVNIRPSAGAVSADASALALAALAAARRGDNADWRAALAAVRATGAAVQPWDATVLGTALMEHSEPGLEQVLGSAAARWGDDEEAA